MTFTRIKSGIWTSGAYRISRYTPKLVMGFRFRAAHNRTVLGTKESLHEAEMLCAAHARPS
jgi:hypothetical protein